jgi:4-amino-4-deoxy-L-arabinose transferase-like glycosyltransferase
VPNYRGRTTSAARPEPRARSLPKTTAATPASVSPWKDPYLGVVMILAAFLLFFSLGDRCLWQDEAETALLAKSILHNGLPIAWDGTNLISQEMSKEFGPDFLWRWSPWVQYYLTAGSFALFGSATVAARLPFAALGLLAVTLTYLLGRRLFDSPGVARLSALFLATSVPFLLHARQTRWYAPAFVLVCCLLLCFVAMTRGSRLAIAGFATSAALLFYTNFFVAIGLLSVLLVSAPLYKSERAFLLRLGLAYLVVLPLVLPGLFFFNSYS